MKSIVKYAIYIVILLVAYFILVGFYSGSITKNSTISEVSQDVSNSAKKMISDTYGDAKTEVEDNMPKTEENKNNQTSKTE